MTDSRDHHCLRCGTYLPSVTVQKPVYAQYMVEGHLLPIRAIVRYEEVEEVAECVRCTGGY